MNTPKKIRMYLGIPSTGDRSDGQCYLLRELQERYSDRIEFVYPDLCAFRIFHDYARNEVVEEFLESGCDVLWFLDSDVVPPKHTLDLITMHWDKWLVAGAPYPVFMNPPGWETQQVVFTVYKGTDGKGLYPSKIPYSGTEFVDGMATGCIFIKREVFKKLSKPYFEFKFDKESRHMDEGEDLGFCMKLQKLGIKFFTDYSMACKHYKHVDLLDVNNYAIDQSSRAIKEYDTNIKKQVEAAVKEAYKRGLDKGREQAAARGAPHTTKSGLILPSSLANV